MLTALSCALFSLRVAIQSASFHWYDRSQVTAAAFGGISQVNANGSVFSATNPPGAAMWYL